MSPACSCRSLSSEGDGQSEEVKSVYPFVCLVFFCVFIFLCFHVPLPLVSHGMLFIIVVLHFHSCDVFYFSSARFGAANTA